MTACQANTPIETLKEAGFKADRLKQQGSMTGLTRTLTLPPSLPPSLLPSLPFSPLA